MLKKLEPMTVLFGPMTVFQKYCHFRCTLVFLEQNSFLCLKNLWKKVFWAFFDKKIDQIWANDGISKIGRKLMTVFQNTVNSNVPSCFCSNDPKTKPMWYMQWRYFQNVWRYIWELALKTFNVPSRKKILSKFGIFCKYCRSEKCCLFWCAGLTAFCEWHFPLEKPMFLHIFIVIDGISSVNDGNQILSWGSGSGSIRDLFEGRAGSFRDPKPPQPKENRSPAADTVINFQAPKFPGAKISETPLPSFWFWRTWATA